MRLPSAADLHDRIGGDWPRLLLRLGIDERFLKNRHGPCPACGGTDRFRFDNKFGRGNFYCSHCGAGDGFRLLMNTNGWSFREAATAVREALGIADDFRIEPRPHRPEPAHCEPAKPSGRVSDLLSSCAPIELVPHAVSYLESRKLWPADFLDLLGAARAEYWHERKKVGTYSAMIGRVRDRNGEVVTAHVTYLTETGKLNLDGLPARKIMSPMTGREGCAVRLGDPVNGALGIAEGIETALAAARFHGLPVWSALNAGMLAKWTPPEGVHHVMICPDHDRAGLAAAERLMDRLGADGYTVALRVSSLEPDQDWADLT